jgi:hypothetical protein
MRNKHLYIGQALWVIAGYCDLLGELDSWLLQIAGEAARSRNWQLARLAIATFRLQQDRCLGEIEERALDYLTALVWSEEMKNELYNEEIAELHEETAEELLL